MKFYLTAIALLACLLSMGQEEANWLTSFDEAKINAKGENKYILISFSGSDWCLPCAHLERDLFSTEDFINFADSNLILVKADFPVRKKNQLSVEQREHNYKLAEVYNKKGSYPVVVIVNEKGKIKGYLKHPLNSTEGYINNIKKIIGDSIN